MRVVVLVSLFLGACDSGLECEQGKLVFTGRPPPELFSFNAACRADCFSLGTGCDRTCDEARVSPVGAIVDDRYLMLVDPESIATNDTGEPLALAFVFGYEDEGTGDPPGWGLFSDGPATYLSNQLDRRAEFIMQSFVIPYAPAGELDPLVSFDSVPLSEPAPAQPGRLEVLTATEGRFRGRFYLSYENTQGRTQGQVDACFNLAVGDVRTVDGHTYRLLLP